MSNLKAKIVGIVGSGRRRSNSKRLLETALNAAENYGCRTQIVDIIDMSYSGCNVCNYCLKSGVCSIADDMTQIYKILDEADGVIVSTPVYFYGVPGKLKLFIDRFQAFWARRYILGKEPSSMRIGGLISVAGSKGKRAFDGVILTVKYFYRVQGIELREQMLIRDCDGEPEELPNHLLENAAEFGKKIADAITKNDNPLF